MDINKSRENLDKKIEKFKKALPIGRTLETSDEYLKFDKKTSKNLKSRRPVIIADKIVNPKGEEEYAVIPGSNQDTKNTTYYGKNGINYYRNMLEVRDNDGQPIKQGEKFKVTAKSTQIPKEDIERIKDKVLNHTKQSSENRKKYQEFKNRYKKSKS